MAIAFVSFKKINDPGGDPVLSWQTRFAREAMTRRLIQRCLQNQSPLYAYKALPPVSGPTVKFLRKPV
jgi:hypothetical protein